MGETYGVQHFENIYDAVEQIKAKIFELNDLQNRFNSVVSDINASGGALGGDLGDFADSVLRELNAKLSNLSRYLSELNVTISLVASTGEEQVIKGKQIMENTTEVK